MIEDAGTPGAVNPAVTLDTQPTKIHRPGGYTSSVRPPEAVTSTEKQAAIASYDASGPAGASELDHLVPLSIGGAASSPRNLGPEPDASPNLKDDLELTLHDAVCDHTLPLAAAQQLAAGDWVTAYTQALDRTRPGSSNAVSQRSAPDPMPRSLS